MRQYDSFARMAGALLSPRASPSMRLSPRDISPGGIAGVVIGSFVGTGLIVVCLLPFILRAWRKRRRTHLYDDPFQAEMGQSDVGGPNSPATVRPHQGTRSYRWRKNTDSPFIPDAVTKSSTLGGVGGQPGATNGFGVGLQQQQAQPEQSQSASATGALDQKAQGPLDHLPPGVDLHLGLTSPISSPLAGTDFPSPSHTPPVGGVPGPYLVGQEASGSGSVVTAQSPASTTQGPWPRGPRDSTRDPSLRRSYGPPSRELTGLTAVSITEEPQEIEPGQHHHRIHLPHVPEAVQRFFHPHRRQPSVATSAGYQSEGLRSPTLDTADTLAQTESAPAIFEAVDTEAPGEAWSYYHPGQAPPAPSAPSASLASARPRIVPPSRTAGIEPISPVSPDYGPGDGPEAEIGASATGRTLVEEPEAISPDTDKPTSPKEGMRFGFRTPSFFKKQIKGVQRMDSIGPQTFMPDIPSPPSHQPSLPSVKPSDVMRPTTDNERHWMVNQEIYMMENSPPPQPTMESTPPADPSPSPLSDQVQSQEDSVAQSPIPAKLEYQTPPNPSMSPEPALDHSAFTVNVADVDMGRTPNSIAMSTPPPTEPSIGNTPSTGITDVEPYIPGEQQHPKIHPKYEDDGTWDPMPQGAPVNYDMYMSTMQLPGNGHIVQPDQSPRMFACEECGRSFDQVHKLNHHKRYHERPHQCTHANCEMRFGTKTHLDRHVNDKHMRAKKYYCRVAECPYSRQGGKSFPRKDNWKRHMLNKHQISPESDPGADLVDEIMGGT